MLIQLVLLKKPSCAGLKIIADGPEGIVELIIPPMPFASLEGEIIKNGTPNAPDCPSTNDGRIKKRNNNIFLLFKGHRIDEKQTTK